VITINANSAVKSARRDMNKAGFAVLCLLILQSIVSYTTYYIIARSNGYNVDFYGFTPLGILNTLSQIKATGAKVLYTQAIAVFFTTLIGNMLPFAVCAYIADVDYGKIFSVPKVSAGKTAVYGFIAVGASIVVSMIVNILKLVFTAFGLKFYSPSFDIPWKSPVGTVFMILAVVIVAPLTEEFICRGVLLNIFRRFGDIFAIVASSLVWALLHGNFVQGLPVFALGLVFGALALQADSIIPTFVIHSINNALSMIEVSLAAKNTFIASFGMLFINFAILSFALSFLFIYYKNFKKFKTNGCKRGFTFFFTCVPMLIVIIYCAVLTVLSVKPA
jgi:membrane protease YdiL (CAAX protease family)